MLLSAGTCWPGSRDETERRETTRQVYGRLDVLGRLGATDFDPFGQKLQEDTDPDRQEPTLPKIDRMQLVDVARVEFLENGDKAIGGDIVLDDERGQSNQADTIDGKC